MSGCHRSLPVEQDTRGGSLRTCGYAPVIARDLMIREVVRVGGIERGSLGRKTIDQNIAGCLGGCRNHRARRWSDPRGICFEALLNRLDRVMHRDMDHRVLNQTAGACHWRSCTDGADSDRAPIGDNVSIRRRRRTYNTHEDADEPSQSIHAHAPYSLARV